MGLQKRFAVRRVSREALLWILLLFSSVFFFVCIKCISPVNTDGTALLRASAMLLSLCVPALLYSKGEETAETTAGEESRGRTAFWKILLFVACAFFFGVFAATLAKETLQANYVFASFWLPTEFSFMSLMSLVIFSFSSVLFPYVLFSSFLVKEGYFACLFPLSCVYAALFFQITSAPLLLVFGLILAVIRLQSNALFPVILANLFFLLGGYGVSVGFFSFDRFGSLPMWAFLLITGVAFAVAFGFALDLRALRVARQTRKRAPKPLFLRFMLIPVATLLVSILLATVFAI